MLFHNNLILWTVSLGACLEKSCSYEKNSLVDISDLFVVLFLREGKNGFWHSILIKILSKKFSKITFK